MKKISFLLIFIFVFSILAVYAQVGSRHFEHSGNYSICPPRGWTPDNLPGSTYTIFTGPTVNGFTPSMNVEDEVYRGTLADHIDNSINQLRTYIPDAKISGREVFRTTSGLSGFTYFMVFNMAGIDMHIVQYVFTTANQRSYIITYGASVDTIRNLQHIFDESARTFEFIR